MFITFAHFLFFRSDTSGSFDSLASGTLSNVNSFNPNFTQIFATENGGYGIAIAHQDSSWTIHVAFITPTSNDLKGPFQIYMAPQQLNINKCNIAYYSFGYSCIINVVTPPDGQPNLVNIEFLSTGSVLGTTQFNDLIAGTMIWNILPLYYGGF